MLAFLHHQIELSTVLEHLQWCSVCDPAKIFLTSNFSYLPFSNPTHKNKTGTANRWETTNSKPPGPIIMIGQSQTGNGSQIIFISLFVWQGLDFAMPFTSLSKLCKNVGPKPFRWANPACFDFSSSNFNLQGHVLSTGGVALMLPKSSANISMRLPRKLHNRTEKVVVDFTNKKQKRGPTAESFTEPSSSTIAHTAFISSGCVTIGLTCKRPIRHCILNVFLKIQSIYQSFQVPQKNTRVLKPPQKFEQQTGYLTCCKCWTAMAESSVHLQTIRTEIPWNTRFQQPKPYLLPKN